MDSDKSIIIIDRNGNEIACANPNSSSYSRVKENDCEFEQLMREWFKIPEIKGHVTQELCLLFSDCELENSAETGLHCHEIDVKFCLYDKSKRAPVFTMDFFDVRKSFQLEPGFRQVRLELIYTHNKDDRNKGIATHFISTLIDYCMDIGVNGMCVHPNPKAENFKGNTGMDKETLVQFYRKFERPNFPIEIFDYS